ncbi:hypothetical protein DNTS_007852 [Danionella cerebrum]|uniref:Cystatin domain-containing protein n=1 Tax=Danionella cerebrum TaxID=2873325 RepID=A0A553RG39_9TELE|nr:hypothetical protein DNTS_007852 [Danionella translucida]
MGRDRILMVFALAWLYASEGHGQTNPSIPCDDRRVEAVVNATIASMNTLIPKDGLMALYQILGAKVQNDSEDILMVQFSAIETDCPVGGVKAWHQCDYLQQADKELSICDSKVELMERRENVLEFECTVEPIVTASVAPCLGCPEKLDLYQEELREPLIHSLSRANSMINHMHFFIFKDLTSATKQVVAGFRYKLEFEVEKSNCTRPEFKVEVMKCNSTVDVAPWRHEVPEVHVECESGVPKSVSRFKRPPGWSPLRMASKVQESSEESKESITVTKSPPLNCPSKPWKEFKPVMAPANATEVRASNTTTADTGFSDLDLLS